jgi:acetolactate synthase-1/2/3 large subunit
MVKNKEEMRVSDYVAEFISSKNVKHVFSIPGGGCIHLNDAFARNEKIEMVACHHEQACALAAEGYARLNQNLGVCLVTSGPGGSNAWTGTLCSYQDSVPVIFISGNVNKDLTTNFTKLNLRQLGDQEFNVVDAVKSFTKYSVQVNNHDDIKYELEKAHYLAKHGRPGPVWIDIPLDIQSSKINPASLRGFSPDECFGESSFDMLSNETKEKIDLALQKMSTSEKPLIIVGHGVRLSNSVELLDELLEKYKIPVITSFNGNDAVSNEYEYYGGRFGTHANISANTIVQEADFVLSLGSRLYVRQIGYNFVNFAKNAYRVYVDIEKNELDKPTIHPDIKICTDVNKFLHYVKNKISTIDINDWRHRCKDVMDISPTVLERHRKNNPLSVYYFMELLNEYMDPNIPVITSDGSANIVGMQILRLKKNQRLFSNKSTAPMGYGLPAAIGACYAHNKNQVICLEGDGSLHMNVHELQTMIHNNLPIKLFVINNDGYVSIKITQKTFCGGLLTLSNSQSGLSLPSYKKLSKAYGIPYRQIKNKKTIKEDLKKCMEITGPVLIEVFVDHNEFHEPKVMASLDKNGKFIPGELQNIKWIK